MRAALVVALIALSGCATLPTPPVSLDPTSPGPPVFGEPVVVDAREGGAEPVLLVHPATGTLFVQGVGSDANGGFVNNLWRSRDQGRTFQRLALPAGAREASLDGIAGLTPKGTLLLSNSGASATTLFRSADEGGSWTPLPIAQPGSHRTWLTANDAVAYFGAMTLGGPIFSYASRDDGRTWGAPMKVRDTSLDVGGPMVVNARGAVTWAYHVSGGPFSQGEEPGWHTMVTKDDASWRRATVHKGEANLATTWAGSTADAAGTFYLLWAEWDASASWFMLTSSGDGETWSEPVRLLAGPGARALPWIASPARGEIGIAWYESAGASDPMAGDHAWRPYYGRVVGADTASPAIEPVQVSDRVLHARGICPEGPGCRRDRQLLDYAGIAYAPDGKVHLVYAATQDVGAQDPRFGHAVVVSQR